MMAASPLDLYAREYFTSINSIANKISTDISNAVAAYEDLWHTLNIKDQHQIINETIIHPNVVLKYTLFQPEEYTNINENATSRQYFADEGKVLSWPDEHAAPFSWKTLSQQDLSVFNDSEENSGVMKSKIESCQPKIGSALFTDSSFDPPNVVLGGSSSKLISKQNDCHSSGNSNFSVKNKSKSVVLRIQATVPAPNKRADNRHKAHSMTENDSIVKHVSLSKSSRTLGKPIPKPRSPPPPPPPKQKLNQNGYSSDKDKKERSVLLEATKCVQSNKSETDASLNSLDDFHFEVNVPMKCDTLPKTGFDFLDNW